MQKPPFQFGLRAAFLAMSGAAVFAWLVVPGARQVRIVATLAVLAALAFAAVLAAAVLIAFGFSLAMLLYHVIRLYDRARNEPRRDQNLLRSRQR